MQKETLRIYHKRLREETSKETRQIASTAIEVFLYKLFKEKQKVFLQGVYVYYPLKSEVSLLSFYEFILKQDIPLYFPKIINQQLEFFRVKDLTQFKKGKFAIMEPVTTEISKEFFGICLVPGLFFDQKGNRCGYGKGYYDRFLKDKNLFTIGVCFQFQLTEEEFAQDFDVPMKMIVTEQNMINTNL